MICKSIYRANIYNNNIMNQLSNLNSFLKRLHPCKNGRARHFAFKWPQVDWELHRVKYEIWTNTRVKTVHKGKIKTEIQADSSRAFSPLTNWYMQNFPAITNFMQSWAAVWKSCAMQTSSCLWLDALYPWIQEDSSKSHSGSCTKTQKYLIR